MGRFSAEGLLIVLLVVWWLFNVGLALVVDVADDEAYYWSWACVDGSALSFGCFDHPPLVAVLVWLGQWIGGTLGIRFFVLLLQPVSLYLLWLVLRKDVADWRDAFLYFAACFAMLPLQVYGFLALPDAVLLFSGVLFLLFFRRFADRPNVARAVLLGVAVALLGYSKYHGILLVLFALLAHRQLFKCRYLYVALVVALVLFAPHLWWQIGHGWPTVIYHLFSRQSGFDWRNPLMVLVNVVVFFNPLLVVAYWHAWRGASAGDADMRWCVLGVVLFFFVCSFFGCTQAQWLLPIAPALLVLQMRWLWRVGCGRYVRYCLLFSCVVILLARVLLFFVPLSHHSQWRTDEASCQAVAVAARHCPVVFHTYTFAAKYAYYTKGESHCVPYYFGRKSQWDYNASDEGFAGRRVLVQREASDADFHLTLPNGRVFHYDVCSCYSPLRGVQLFPQSALKDVPADGNPVRMRIKMYNPYSFNLPVCAGDSLFVSMYYRVRDRFKPRVTVPVAEVLVAGDTTVVDCVFPASERIPLGCVPSGVFLSYER